MRALTTRRFGSLLAIGALVGGALAAPAGAAEDPVTCFGKVPTIVGTGGPDLLTGTEGPDVIAGLGGDDTIDALGGDDLVCGNGGADLIDAGRGHDRVLGGFGDDEIFGGPGHDEIFGGPGGDVVWAGAGDDLVRGGDGDDLLTGGPGSDAIEGFGGRDGLQGGAGDDALSGGADRDRIRGGDDADTLVGGYDRDRVWGGRGTDVVVGGDGDDYGGGGGGTDVCASLEVAADCEDADPTMWEWLRTDPAEHLAVRLGDVVVLQEGCRAGASVTWTAVLSEAAPPPADGPLTEAAAALRSSAAACNVDTASWRIDLRAALVHLEDFNALVTGGAPYSVAPTPTAGTVAPVAIDVFEAAYGHLLGGNPPAASSMFWSELVHPDHTRQLAEAAPEGGYDVLFTGSSFMANAGVPEVFTAADGRTAYNAAMPGSGPEVQSLWMLGQAAAMADPDMVIIGVEGRAYRNWDIIPGSCRQPTDEWEAAAAMRTAAFSPVEALGGRDENAIFFGNPAAPEPSRPLRMRDYYLGKYGPLGNRVAFPPNQTVEQKQAAVESIYPWSIGYDPCDERLVETGTLVAALEGMGIDVVVVGMPISDIRATAFDPGGGTDLAAGRAVLADLWAEVASITTAAGGTFIDLSNDPLLPEERFRDASSHVDAVGAQIFTTLLAEAVAG